MNQPFGWRRVLVAGLAVGALTLGYGLLKDAKLIVALRSSGVAMLVMWILGRYSSSGRGSSHEFPGRGPSQTEALPPPQTETLAADHVWPLTEIARLLNS